MKTKLGFILSVLLFGALAYGQLPEPGPARSVQVPAVKEATLKNGLRVAVVERKAVPSVSVSLVVNAGSDKEDANGDGDRGAVGV